MWNCRWDESITEGGQDKPNSHSFTSLHLSFCPSFTCRITRYISLHRISFPKSHQWRCRRTCFIPLERRMLLPNSSIVKLRILHIWKGTFVSLPGGATEQCSPKPCHTDTVSVVDEETSWILGFILTPDRRTCFVGSACKVGSVLSPKAMYPLFKAFYSWFVSVGCQRSLPLICQCPALHCLFLS